MIRGYMAGLPGRRRPFPHAILEFPTLDHRQLDVEFLIDTGADRSVLSPKDAQRLGVDVAALPAGQPTVGVGGRMETFMVPAILNLEEYSVSLELTILSPGRSSMPIPSLLGRNILSRFALFFEERTERVLLLEPTEADALNLP